MPLILDFFLCQELAQERSYSFPQYQVHTPYFLLFFFLLLKFQKFHHRNDTREVIVQTGVIGICGRWPLAAPLLIVSRLPL